MTEIQLLEKTELILIHTRAGFEVNVEGAQSVLKGLPIFSSVGTCLTRLWLWVVCCLSHLEDIEQFGSEVKPAWAACKTLHYPLPHNAQCKQETH